MRSVTPRFLDTTRQSRTMALHVDAYPADGSGPISIPVNSGSVTLDRTADVRGRLTVSISDPSLFPRLDTDTLAPYGTELLVRCGFRYPGGAEELAALGYFRVQDVTRLLPATQGVQVTGWDRSQQLADERFTQPKTVGGPGVRHIDVMQSLISEVYPDAVFSVVDDASTLPVTVLDQDRLPALHQFADAIGYEVFIDGGGTWVLRPTPDPSTAAVAWTVDSGSIGVMVSVSDKVTRDNVPNGIVAVGEPSDGSTPVRALVTDDTPGSPTLWGGPFGKVPRFYSSPFIRTALQAGNAGRAMLADSKGKNRSIDLTHVPNPALEPGDLLLVVYPDGSRVRHIIDAVEIPLAPTGQMTASTREVSVGS